MRKNIGKKHTCTTLCHLTTMQESMGPFVLKQGGLKEKHSLVESLWTYNYMVNWYGPIDLIVKKSLITLLYKLDKHHAKVEPCTTHIYS